MDDPFDFGGFVFGFVEGPVDGGDAAHAEAVGEFILNDMDFVV